MRQEIVERMAKAVWEKAWRHIAWEADEEAQRIFREQESAALDALLDALEEHPDLFDVNFPATVEALVEQLRGES
jgi:hypothetical protein